MSDPRNAIQALLAEEMGLEMSSLGARAVEHAIRQRMRACGMPDDPDYARHLGSAPEELQALVELLVVPETWFFRDREPFDFLRRFVQTDWAPTHPHGRLRVLSLPCATGEEAFSIAIMLLEAGLSPNRYRIDAADISRAFLEKAEAGVYSRNSFRASRLDRDKRYFEKTGAGFRVTSEVRSSIRFRWANILKENSLPAAPSYEVVFCRNLLIYQHAAARQRVASKLDRCLAEGGLLFVGHAEMLSLFPRSYQAVRTSGVFAYRKTRPVPTEGTKPPGGPSRSIGTAPARASLISEPPRVARPPAPAGPSSARAPAEALSQARQLADEGRLAEAAVLCETALRQPLREPGFFTLLGVIRERAGQFEAAEALLNQALYLDAEDYETLMHLSLLKARRGDAPAAERLRRRAARAHERREGNDG